MVATWSMLTPSRRRRARGAHRVGVGAAARVADGGDVVDVDPEPQRADRGGQAGHLSLSIVIGHRDLPA